MGLFVDTEQSKNASINNTRNRKAGATGNRTQEKPAGTYDELVRAVQEFRGGKHDSVACAWHPEGTGEFVQTRKGWIKVYQGEAGYQLNSGAYIKFQG